MSITSKLAVDFVKRNFNSFNFDNKIKKASEVNSRTVYDAHVSINCADIKLFEIDCCCINVKLPEKLCSKLGLEEALKLIDKENMDMESYFLGRNKYVRVTTNRLLMLEKLMKKSGLINPINHDVKDMLIAKIAQMQSEVKDMLIAKIAQMQSEASSTYASMLNDLDELRVMIKNI